MINKFKKLDHFHKNIIIVFSGTSLANFLNLLYQLLIAHQLTAEDFAAFNALLSIYVIITAPIATLHTAVAKFSAEFSAKRETRKITEFLSGLAKRMSVFALLSLVVFWVNSGFLAGLLKIYSPAVLSVFYFIVFLTWLLPVFSGGAQGLELFGWATAASIISGALKLLLTAIFMLYGYGILGALGAFLFANLAALFINYFPLRGFISFSAQREKADYRGVVFYLLPLTTAYFCFNGLVNLDMILVRRFFTPLESGFYSLAQMAGKIFLFLPGAISVVMFPRTSGLKATNMDTLPTLKRSLLYVSAIVIFAAVFYNLFPAAVLKALTGKVYAESILLGRLFSVSMSFFAVIYVFINYFLSVKDFRFIKYLIALTAAQASLLFLLHRSLAQVQAVLCAVSFLLCLACLNLAFRKRL